MQTVDERLAALEQAANTISTATLNAVGAVIKAVTKLDAVDRQALWDDLEGAKSVSVQNGNQANYLQILSLFQKNIS
jgi:galactitol-specific phosphotransferase system IIC component